MREEFNRYWRYEDDFKEDDYLDEHHRLINHKGITSDFMALLTNKIFELF